MCLSMRKLLCRLRVLPVTLGMAGILVLMFQSVCEPPNDCFFILPSPPAIEKPAPIKFFHNASSADNLSRKELLSQNLYFVFSTLPRKKTLESSPEGSAVETTNASKTDVPIQLENAWMDDTAYQSVALALSICQNKIRRGTSDLLLSLNRQLRQATTMLKSVLLFSQLTIQVVVLVEDVDVFFRLKRAVGNWPRTFSSRIKFSMYRIVYPLTRRNYRNVFRPCATARLFMPEQLQKLDAVLYVDTDVLFFRPVEQLWQEFQFFDNKQVIGLGSLATYKSSRLLPIPEGKGYNNGVMLMNLTRMRKIRGGWNRLHLNYYEKYKRKITFSQDILNMIFSKYPERLYIFPCEWNYTPQLCLNKPYASIKEFCPAVKETGISLMHGTSGAFFRKSLPEYNRTNNIFFEFYSVFESYHLGDNQTEKLLFPLQRKLTDYPFKCHFVENVYKLFLSELEKHIQWQVV